MSYYPAGAVDVLSDSDGMECDEAALESYRSSHSLLCLIFETKSPAAFEISLGESASKAMLEIVRDPYLGISAHCFGDATLQIAGLCVTDEKISKDSPLRQRVLELLSNLAKTYSHLESAMVEDADYMYLMTYPLMPLSMKSSYGALMADFEAAMKVIVVENSDEIATITTRLDGCDEYVYLHSAREESDDRERYSVEVVRRYLANALVHDYMPLEAFDALLQMSEKAKGKPSDIIRAATLKKIVRERTNKLTEIVDATGAFPITGALMVALMEVGYVGSNGSSDYRNLIFRTDSDRPWLSTPAKFAGETDDLESTRSEFLAYCRIITGS